MASLLPFISEILPMIMPSPTLVTRAKQLEPPHPTVEGPVIQREAVVDKCDKMCASGEKVWSLYRILNQLSIRRGCQPHHLRVEAYCPP